MRFARESVQPYRPGDIVIIGGNVPHAFISSREHYDENNPEISKAIYLLFRKDMFGEAFLSMPENYFLQNIFSEAGRCFKIDGKDNSAFPELIEDIARENGFKRLNLLMQLLYEIDRCEHKEYLNIPDLSYETNLKDVERINRVYEFVFSSFNKQFKSIMGTTALKYKKSYDLKQLKERL